MSKTDRYLTAHEVNEEKFCVLVARHLHDDRSTVLTMAAVERIKEKITFRTDKKERHNSYTDISKFLY